MIKTFPFRLDIEKEYNNRMYSVNSNDLKTVKFTFVVTDNGIPLDLTGLTVRIAIRKPDKKAVWQDCTVTNAPKGEAEVILESQAYIKKGEHEAELMLYKGTDTVAITQKFHYRAAEGIMSDKSLKSETVLGPIDQKLAEVEGLVKDLRENGTGVDSQARKGVEDVTAALAEMVNNVASKEYVTEEIVRVNTGGTVDITTKADKVYVDSKFEEELLLYDVIPRTKQSIEYQNQNVSKITHKKVSDNTIVRTDTFAWSDNQVIETRTSSTGKTITLKTNFNTLETEVI